MPFDIYAEPERVSFPSVAFKTAPWFWAKNALAVRTNDSNESVTDLNIMADGTFLVFVQLTHSITSRISDLKKRMAGYMLLVSMNECLWSPSSLLVL